MNTAWAKKTNVTNFTTAQHSLRCHKFYYSTALTTMSFFRPYTVGTKCHKFYYSTALTTMSFFLRRHSTHYDSTLFIYADTTLTTMSQILRRHSTHYNYSQLDFSSTDLMPWFLGLIISKSWDVTKIHILKEYNFI